MTFRDALSDAAERISAARLLFCDTPLLDASVLLSFAAGISREKLFASYPDEVPDEIIDRFESLLAKRLRGLPVSYIRNVKEFYGREFYVDETVLVPRPDTEIIVEKALSLADKNSSVLDLCTGSGCIGTTMKLEAPDLRLTASDISEPALQTARRNAEMLGAEIGFVQSNLFENIAGSFDIIVTNPPYLTSEESSEIFSTGWPEPKIALKGGNDGLDLIRIIIHSALDYLNNNSYLLIEAGPDQAETTADLLSAAGYENIEITPDLAGRNRVISGSKSGTYD